MEDINGRDEWGGSKPGVILVSSSQVRIGSSAGFSAAHGFLTESNVDRRSHRTVTSRWHSADLAAGDRLIASLDQVSFT